MRGKWFFLYGDLYELDFLLSEMEELDMEGVLYDLKVYEDFMML